MMCNTTEDGSAHTSLKGTIVNCNCSFEGGNGGYDSNECSDDGESRGGMLAESHAFTHQYIQGRIFKKGDSGTAIQKVVCACVSVRFRPDTKSMGTGGGGGGLLY